jgi:hypothetical protein
MLTVPTSLLRMVSLKGGSCYWPDFHLEDQGKGVVLLNNEQLSIDTGQSA